MNAKSLTTAFKFLVYQKAAVSWLYNNITYISPPPPFICVHTCVCACPKLLSSSAFWFLRESFSFLSRCHRPVPFNALVEMQDVPSVCTHGTASSSEYTVSTLGCVKRVV